MYSNSLVVDTTLKRSDLVQKLVYLDGRPFRLAGYEPHYSFYDSPSDKILLICGRQVAKSTTLANFMIVQSVAVPQYKSLFVAPSKEQSSKFSNTRVMKSMMYSPLVKKYFVDAKRTNSVMTRMLTNGSEMYFTYCIDDPDRARGISADVVYYDEVQSMMLREIVPVINECMGASPHKKNVFCGTPLSAENDIEMMWQESNRMEWVVLCPACKKWNILGMNNLGDTSVICAGLHCRKPLDVRVGQWFTTNPEGGFDGYHIPQIAMYYNVGTPKAYAQIIQKRKDYSDSKFKNEVMGISDELGARLISFEQLASLCTPSLSMCENGPTPEGAQDVIMYVAGVDHGGYGHTFENSRSALTIYGIRTDNTKLRVVYGKIYKTGHPMQDIKDIATICTTFNVQMVVADEGGGALANTELRNILGHHRVVGCRYGSSHGGIKWADNSPTPSYNVDKTLLIDQFMQTIMYKQIEFPNLQMMDKPHEFFQDILSEFEETTPTGRRIWKNSQLRPDDWLHSCAYAWLAAKVVTGQVQAYAPSVEE